MSTERSVTRWIADLKKGSDEAVEKLVERYFEKLVRLAKSKYRRTFDDLPRPAEDEEDAALSALKSFWARTRNGHFPDLANRDDLWNLLAKITIRKIFRQRQRATAKKRGGGESPSLPSEDLDKFVDKISDRVAEAELKDTYRAVMGDLPDDVHRQIAHLYLLGKTGQEIAQDLELTERTVYRKLKFIRDKWDVSRDRCDAHFDEPH